MFATEYINIDEIVRDLHYVFHGTSSTRACLWDSENHRIEILASMEESGDVHVFATISSFDYTESSHVVIKTSDKLRDAILETLGNIQSLGFRAN